MKEYKPKYQKVLAIQLTPENINEIQKITRGSIKETALPINQQCIALWIEDKEVWLEMSEWYIQKLSYGKLIEEQVLSDYMFRERYSKV